MYRNNIRHYETKEIRDSLKGKADKQARPPLVVWYCVFTRHCPKEIYSVSRLVVSQVLKVEVALCCKAQTLDTWLF